MKCIVELVSIGQIVNMIRHHQLDLQPDFKRGSSWNLQMKQRLIDTILRGWIISAIQVVEDNSNFVKIVLDGQQRLQTIYSFLCDEFVIDGSIEPYDSQIDKYDGVKFSNLDNRLKNRILDYKINLVTLSEYSPIEVAEIFNRLNQSVRLTSAEKRNVYFGKTRDQVKYLMDYFEEKGFSKQSIGFSNSRLAYEEILAKFCLAIENNSLRHRISSNELSDRYKYDKEFNEEIIFIAKNTIDVLSDIISRISNHGNRFNLTKPSLFSWLIFFTHFINDKKRKFENVSISEFSDVLYLFETSRDSIKKRLYDDAFSETRRESALIIDLLITYNQKCSMGSNDMKSVIIRDACLYIYCCEKLFIEKWYFLEPFNYFIRMYKRYGSFEAALQDMIDVYNWGGTIYEK